MNSGEIGASRLGGGQPLRVFFGLWPSQETASDMLEWARDAHALCGGRMMRTDTFHLTLAFLGSTPAERVEQLIHEAPQWPAAVGELVLQRFGRFAGPRIIWAGPGQSDADRVAWLDQLYDGLWQRLQALGWDQPAATFRPHVSLLRKAGSCNVQQLHRPPLVWRPAQCVLVASTPSEGGSNYRVLAAMPLTQARAG